MNGPAELANKSRPGGQAIDRKPMSKSYAQVIEQIEALKSQAEKLRRKEIEGVVASIREAIATYSLTPADLGFSAAGFGKRKTAGRKPGPKAAAKRGTAGAKYRDSSGNMWGGRGPRPRWLREALAGGKTLQDFAA